MSALPTKADINWCTLDVRFVPKADLRGAEQRAACYGHIGFISMIADHSSDFNAIPHDVLGVRMPRARIVDERG